jgi:hypothetical protein
MGETKECMFCVGFYREKIPFSNIEKMVIEIETLHLPNEFVYEIGDLIRKYQNHGTE